MLGSGEGPLDGQVAKLSTRLANHVDANCDAISYFAAQHPELGPEDRATFARALHLAAVKLTALARWFRGEALPHDIRSQS